MSKLPAQHYRHPSTQDKKRETEQKEYKSEVGSNDVASNFITLLAIILPEDSNSKITKCVEFNRLLLNIAALLLDAKRVLSMISLLLLFRSFFFQLGHKRKYSRACPLDY